jgi:hypothetical protein
MDLREAVRSVEVQDTVDLALDVSRTGRLPLESTHPAHKRKVVGLAGHHPFDHEGRVGPPSLYEPLELLYEVDKVNRSFVRFDVIAQEGAGLRTRRGVDKDQLLDPIRMSGREQLRHEATLGQADEAGFLYPLGIHDSGDVLDTLFEDGQSLKTVGTSDPSFVEHEYSEVLRVVLKYTPI